ncbi:MAG TPA: MarR family transcriptional regulator [Flavobacteriaceae bacterium]|nr:MarR family transcriptional regulator [Flavobacteriaceae bacterium]
MGDLSKELKSKFPNERVKALINVLYTANWINNYQNAFFKPFGISPQQYNILRILRGAGEPLKVQVIKERMIDRSPNATRLMDKLCEKQLIERLACDSDRRVVHIKITSQGLDLLTLIADDFNNEILKNITEDEAHQLNKLLDKFR